ncbi:hypothetical protein NON20_02955 [Synechocystis sp. B12]|nr:hypothetical protein NON20_02955 [Synechocystis sp. B12]
MLWDLRHQGYQPPLAAIAREQTAGRGQWGRTWQSPPGDCTYPYGWKLIYQ